MISRDEVEELEKLIGQLQGLHTEISVLSKKSPSDAVNAFKLGLINKIVESANIVLGPKYLPFAQFSGFDSDDLPSTSDVTFVIAQYLEEVERYRSDNIIYSRGHWMYVINGDVSDIRTGSPSKVKEK